MSEEKTQKQNNHMMLLLEMMLYEGKIGNWDKENKGENLTNKSFSY